MYNVCVRIEEEISPKHLFLDSLPILGGTKSQTDRKKTFEEHRNI